MEKSAKQKIHRVPKAAMSVFPWLVGALVVLLALLQYGLWLGRNGIHDLRMQQLTLQTIVQENSQLLQRNQRLKYIVIDLKSGLEGIEERARSELGMIKDDETFFQIIPEKAASRLR